MSFKSEFRLGMFGFGDGNMRELYQMKSRWLSIATLFGRCVATCYFVAVLVASGLTYDTPKWPVFLTNWNIVLYTCYFIAGTSLSGYLWCTQRTHQVAATATYGAVDESNIGLSTTDERRTEENVETTDGQSEEPVVRVLGVAVWMLMEISTALTIIIVLLYWIVLTGISGEGYFKYTKTNERFVEINTHGVNLLCLLIDFFFHKIPVRVLHFLYVFVVATLYVVLSVVYSVVTGKALYGLFDWKYNAGSAFGIMVGAYIALFLVHMLLYGLYRVKMIIFKAMNCV